MEILLMIIRRIPRLSTELTEAWSKIMDFLFGWTSKKNPN
jgi:hypothetical protein